MNSQTTRSSDARISISRVLGAGPASPLDPREQQLGHLRGVRLAALPAELVGRSAPTPEAGEQ